MICLWVVSMHSQSMCCSFLQVPGIDATDVRANNNDALVSAMRNGHGEVEALLRQVLTHEYEETKKRQRHDEETRHVAQRVTHGSL